MNRTVKYGKIQPCSTTRSRYADQTTVSVKLPLDAYDRDDNARVGTWVLLEPDQDNDSGDEQGSEDGNEVAPRGGQEQECGNVL